MRKKLIGILAVTLTLSVNSMCVYAAGMGHANKFADTDKNGICDNYSENYNFTDVDTDGACDNCGNNFVDANEDGICGNYNGNGNKGGQNAGNGHDYADNDNDGVCDNYTTDKQKQRGTGRGNGCGSRCGQ